MNKIINNSQLAIILIINSINQHLITLQNLLTNSKEFKGKFIISIQPFLLLQYPNFICSKVYDTLIVHL